MTDDFFTECRDSSRIKAEIVSEYFPVWASIIIRGADPPKIAYIDLFAGRGRYDDGTPSTPLLILEKAIADDVIGSRLVTVFTDTDEGHVKDLEEEIRDLPGIDKLKHLPHVSRETVGQDIVSVFKGLGLMPSLVFLDPCGYKGLSLELVNSVLKDWACECLFFFNYNRINAGISNECVEEHINGIFGSGRADELRLGLIGKDPIERERLILEKLVEALVRTYGRFVQWFRFKNKQGTRTSHYLIFVTKHSRGYEIMKEIMGAKSSVSPQGVPSFEYNPAATGQFQFSKPLDDLKNTLLDECAGQSLAVEELFQTHHVGQTYLRKNYKAALLSLQEDGRIIVHGQGRKGTMANHVTITFPSTDS